MKFSKPLSLISRAVNWIQARPRVENVEKRGEIWDQEILGLTEPSSEQLARVAQQRVYWTLFSFLNRSSRLRERKINNIKTFVYVLV